jgi:hypothetical protein
MKLELAGRLVESWRARGVDLNPGASEATVQRLEERWQVQLPATLRAYLRIADGMPEGLSDPMLMRFWPVHEIVPLAEGAPEMLGEGQREHGRALLFADFFIWSHAYAIQTEPPWHVLMVGGKRPLDLRMELERFIEAYLAGEVVTEPSD